ncbi:hypothetical protein QMO39_31895, partial [Pseudomonas aeruginosa]|uniref:hypothetical protein n=1 Tax=Pseudomonas aeruginosa TaxID=287 RepID=UPI0024AF4689
YLDGSLEGQLQALAGNLPARSLIRADGFKGAAGLPDTLTLNAIQLDAGGDLKSGYLIRGGARLPGEGGAGAVGLGGRGGAPGRAVLPVGRIAPRALSAVTPGFTADN